MCRCEEVESRDEETHRKKIEEQLSQAMIRYNRNNSFLEPDYLDPDPAPYHLDPDSAAAFSIVLN